MEFNKKNLYCFLNNKNLKIGSKGYLSCYLSDIKDYIERNESPSRLDGIDLSDEGTPFLNILENGEDNYSQFFYLLEEPEETKFRPFKNCDEVEQVLKFGDRIIWTDHPNFKIYYLGCGAPNGDLLLNTSAGFFSVEKLQDYTAEDGRPLGIMEG